MLKQRWLQRKKTSVSWTLAFLTWLYIYWTQTFPKSSCSLHRKLCHVVALLLKGCFALSRLLLSDFLLFNVLFLIFIMGSQILRSGVLSLESWVPEPEFRALGPRSWVPGLGYWVLILGYANKKDIFNKRRHEKENYCRETFFTEVNGNRIKHHLCKKHLHKDLSKNSCSVSDIKNTKVKHSQIRSKIPTKSVVQVFIPELIEEQLFSRLTESVFYPFFWLQCVKQLFTIFVSLFLQKIRCRVLFSYKLGTLQFIFQKFYINWNEIMTASFI